MRADMFKVIVERQRLGFRQAASVKLKRDKKLLPKFIGLKRHVSEQTKRTKSLNENLAPFKRFLMKQRGRKWDEVYSEIRARIDTGSTVKMHILEHIEDFIAVHISIDKNGNWFHTTKKRGVQYLHNSWPILYVDPVNGIIMETRPLRNRYYDEIKRQYYSRRPKPKRGLTPNFQRKSSREIFVLHCEHWFQYLLDTDPKCSDGQLWYEIICGTWVEHGRWAIVSKKTAVICPAKAKRTGKL